MDDEHEEKHPYRKGIGADLILPLMAAAYAAYYVYTIREFPWEAQMNGTFIAAMIWLLVAALLVRTVLRLRRGEVTLRATGITTPRGKLVVRALFVALTAGNILLMPWLGFTLTVVLFLASSMWLLGVRSLKPLILIPLLAGSVGYVFFIVALDTRLPKGPIELLLQWLF
ncbi:MAG: tripartite tricarboxylate transporter TctB family protein [Kiloniellaceae bacterium]